jgi:hypothetical protein
MAKNVKDYIPRRKNARSTWAATLKNAIAVKGPLVGESAGDISNVQNAAQGIVDETNNMAAAKATYEAAIKNSKQKISGHVKTIRQHAQRMKTHPSYTKAIGLALGIASDAYMADAANSRPVLKISKVPKGYAIKYKLMGFFDGVNIYRKRPGDADFTFLVRDTRSPFIDKDPMVDGTQYHAYFVSGDVEVGKISAEVEIKL